MPRSEHCNVEAIVLSACLIVGANRFSVNRDEIPFAIEVALAAAPAGVEPGIIGATKATPAVSESLKNIATLSSRQRQSVSELVAPSLI